MLVKRIAVGGVIAHTVGRFNPERSSGFVKLTGLVAEPENVFPGVSCDIVVAFSSEFTAEIIGKRLSVRKKRISVTAEA